MTNKEFCARLRKAKKLAMDSYPTRWCIYKAGKVAIFDEGGFWESWYKKDIADVFDNSIRNLGEEP